MSGLNWGVGDLLSVTKLAWDLYHKCYLVAREAPEDFRQLVNELASLQGVLRTLRDDINSDTSFLDRLGDNRKENLERCLGSCFHTLHKLQTLVIKYRELGVGDGKQFWRKIKWVSKQGEILALKSRIMVHNCNISLCMSSIGNSSLARIETSMMQALERQDTAKEATETADDLRPVARSQTAPAAAATSKAVLEEKEEEEDVEGLGLQGISRAFTGATLVESNTDASPDLTPPASEEDYSGFSYPKITSSKPEPPAIGKMKKASTFSTEADTKGLPPSPVISEECQSYSPKKPKARRKPSLYDEPGTREQKTKEFQKQDGVMDIVADAMQELATVRQKEQSARPLRIVREDPAHTIDDALGTRFQQLAEDELRIRRLSAKDWLRVATWWLLKTRFYTQKAGDPSTKSPHSQAYADLSKSSWILHTIILHRNNLSSLMTDENRKLFYNLSDGINEDLSSFQPPTAAERQALMDQNINIWELLQPEEEPFDENILMSGVDNQRWITVDQDDAGEEDEKVILRTFVNAAIGGKKHRIKSRGTPYMLLLSTQCGESQPKITLCNQSGTMSLTKVLTPEDLQDQNTAASPHVGAEVKDGGLPMSFGELNVVIAFASEDEQNSFMDLPRDYFNAIKRREPRQLEKAIESVLFERSVETLEQLKPSSLQPPNPRQQYRSCNLRILETKGREGWRTTRRLVISSSAGESRPWCFEFFLPLSNVRICRQGATPAVIIKWSDCTHEQSDRTDGNYNRVYSYVYDENNPNKALSLVFSNSADAAVFEHTILNLSAPPIFTWSLGPDPQHVYNIVDSEAGVKKYMAVLLTHTRLEWRYSELFYMYRDTDYIYEHVKTSVRFPHAYYTDYISSHVDKLFKPDPGTLPLFSHCEKRVGCASVQFDDEQTSFGFMSSLTSGHQLVFSRRVHYITVKPSRRLGSFKSSKGQAEVQLWQKDNSIRLTARFEDGRAKDPWLTFPIQKEGVIQLKDSNRISLPKVIYTRGRQLDLKELVARESKEARERGEGPVTIDFESARDREEFAGVVEGRAVKAVEGAGGVGKSVFEELMGLK
ncbi:MAG: hypothetical protein Q9220_003659 [cf. Caloplaca sp. 1 TL-2023]